MSELFKYNNKKMSEFFMYSRKKMSEFFICGHKKMSEKWGRCDSYESHLPLKSSFLYFKPVARLDHPGIPLFTTFFLGKTLYLWEEFRFFPFLFF